MKRFPAALALLALLPTAARAQPDRFEVGQHLRAFEAAWDEHTDEAGRKRALALLGDVTSHFFKGRLDEVARSLDRARHGLRSEKPAAAEVQWAESLAVAPATRLADTTLPELAVTLRPFYQVAGGPVKGAALRLTLLAPKAADALARHEAAIDTLPLEAKLPLKG